MSPVEPRHYVRVPGQRRGFLRSHSLWLGADHLLLVDSTRFSETYKRFYLRDIQTILVRKAPRFVIPYYWVLLSLVAVVALIVSLNPFREILFWPPSLILAGVGIYLYQASMFQSCTCHLITRVTKAELPSLFRLSTARQFVDTITPRIVAVQGQLPADWVERSASLEETATTADQNPEAPVDLLPAARFSWMVVIVFALVLVDAGFTFLQLRNNNSAAMATPSTFNIIALGVFVSVAIVRLTRQKASRALRGLVLSGLLVVGGVMYGSIMLQSIDQQVYHQTHRNTLLYPGMRPLALFEIFADLAVAIPGLVLAFRQKGKP